MEKGGLLYSGKAKTLYESEDPNELICQFRNDASAFDGKKKASIDRKGMINNHVNAFVMRHLASQGIKTHFIDLLDDEHARVKRLEMLPIECVVRNVSAGGVCRRLGVEAGLDLNPPIFEFFLKNDALGDPMITESHIRTFQWAKDEDIVAMKALTLTINDHLKKLFEASDMILVDYKLEFGHHHGVLFLGDEFTPDGCRLWDKATRKVLDKDRFRHDMGNVIEAYEEVAHRLGVKLPVAA